MLNHFPSHEVHGAQMPAFRDVAPVYQLHNSRSHVVDLSSSHVEAAEGEHEEIAGEYFRCFDHGLTRHAQCVAKTFVVDADNFVSPRDFGVGIAELFKAELAPERGMEISPRIRLKMFFEIRCPGKVVVIIEVGISEHPVPVEKQSTDFGEHRGRVEA